MVSVPTYSTARVAPPTLMVEVLSVPSMLALKNAYVPVAVNITAIATNTKAFTKFGCREIDRLLRSSVLKEYELSFEQRKSGFVLVINLINESESSHYWREPPAEECLQAQLIQEILDKADSAEWDNITGKPFDVIDNDTLKVENNVLKVNTVDEANPDYTQPITSRGVNTIVGNIQALLELI